MKIWYNTLQLEPKVELMKVSYKKLWKLLIDKDMNKTDLRIATGISTSTIAKLSKGEDVTVSILTRICAALGCDVGDIMEIDKSVNETEAVK